MHGMVGNRRDQGREIMAKGRRRYAPEVHMAKGTYSHDPQRENKNAPKANGRNPLMPTWFGVDEATKWHELVADLTLMGVLSSEAREILIAYCTSYGQWMSARRTLIKEGMTIPTKMGLSKHPMVSERDKQRDVMNKLLPEFGLTPASRSKLVAMKLDESEDPFTHILSRLTGGN